MTERPCAKYAARNAAPILEVLRREFRDCGSVLEIGSGTGQHAVTFAAELDHLRWQTSDLDENHAGIVEWIEYMQLGNVVLPLSLDVRTAVIAAAEYDAVFSANTAHIMGIDAVGRMFELAATGLNAGGVFCLYGPFRLDGEFSTPSNREFDASLRRRDPDMGIRDLEALDKFASAGGMARERLYAMPSNNCIAVWRKGGST